MAVRSKLAIILVFINSATWNFIHAIKLNSGRVFNCQNSNYKLSSHRYPVILQSSNKDSSELSTTGDKLIYDTQSNRFYEALLDEKAEVAEFCLLDKTTGQPILLTREEKERIFLDAIQSYYFSGKSGLPDEQFDRLREDLSWEGSALVTLNRNETLFLNAIVAYNKGQPILTDIQFDELKTSLRDSNSLIAVQSEPKCYADTGICKVTWKPDVIRTGSLYVPAVSVATLLYLGVLYEIPFVRSNFNPLLGLLLGAGPIFVAAKQITENFLFKTPSVAAGPCPSCGVENRVFFGDVLGVKGEEEESQVSCTNCKVPLTIKRTTLRVSTLAKSKKV